MILGTMNFTIDIPDQLPDFQPLWAWISAAVAAWYAAMTVWFRVSGKGRQIHDNAVKRKEESKDWGWFWMKDTYPEVDRHVYLDWNEPSAKTGLGPCRWTGKVFVNEFGNLALPLKKTSGEQPDWNRWRYADMPNEKRVCFNPDFVAIVRLLASPIEYLIVNPAKLSWKAIRMPINGWVSFVKGKPKA